MSAKTATDTAAPATPAQQRIRMLIARRTRVIHGIGALLETLNEVDADIITASSGLSIPDREALNQAAELTEQILDAYIGSRYGEPEGAGPDEVIHEPLIPVNEEPGK